MRTHARGQLPRATPGTPAALSGSGSRLARSRTPCGHRRLPGRTSRSGRWASSARPSPNPAPVRRGSPLSRTPRRGCYWRASACPAPRKVARLASASSSRDMSPQAPSSSSAPAFLSNRGSAAGPARPRQEREDVVAVLALRLGDVHLEPVAEPEESFGSVAVVDEPVEGGEEGRPVRHRAVARIGMRLPAFGVSPHAECAEALLCERRRPRAEGSSPSPGTSVRRGPRGVDRFSGRRWRRRRVRAGCRASRSCCGCRTSRVTPRS